MLAEGTISEETTATERAWRSELRLAAYWLTLGAAAGGLGGFLVGGILGRLAMLLLRFTSDASVRGIESDDGFTIGRFDLVSSFNLVMVTTIFGAAVGLIMVFGRPFLPRRWMPLAWGVAGALVGGGLIVRTDGVDFTLLEPRWLAIALFVALPAVGAALIAYLVETFHQFWWRNWRATAGLGIFAIPTVVAFPFAIAGIVGAAIVLAVRRSSRLTAVASGRVGRVAAAVAFLLLLGLGAFDLARDTRELL